MKPLARDTPPEVERFLIEGYRRMTPWEKLRRVLEQRVKVGSDEEEIDVASPEDTILQKLHWYRLGGGVSDRQWDDLLGVLKVQKDLDWSYLSHWSRHLGVEELYHEALRDAGIGT